MSRFLPFVRDLLVSAIGTVVPAEPAFIRKFLTDFVETLVPILAVSTFVVPGSISELTAFAFAVLTASGAAALPALRRAYPDIKEFVLMYVEGILYPDDIEDIVAVEEEILVEDDYYDATISSDGEITVQAPERP